MDIRPHTLRVGTHEEALTDIPTARAEANDFISKARKKIEPWLSAVFQSEHLNLLIGSGFTTGISQIAGSTATGMDKVVFGTKYDAPIDKHAEEGAAKMKRGKLNIEDQFRSAMAVLEGLKVIDSAEAKSLGTAMDSRLREFLKSLLLTEQGIAKGSDADHLRRAQNILQSFLLSFASRAASRERLQVFTTNYDRLIEWGCDLAGLRVIDRFVGALNPVFRSSRIEVDVHYNPPGIRGEPRFMEGVIRLTKLHGSIDWHYDKDARLISRRGIPFGAPESHTDVPAHPIDTVMIYPNPAKDVETTEYPYAELFRDFAASVCRPNSVVVTYGYGFGDDHINRVLLDMLTIPSTHVVIMSFSADSRLSAFLEKTRHAQVTLLIGPHFSNLETLVDNYLPKPTLDYITGRMTELLKHRPDDSRGNSKAAGTAPSAAT